MNDGVAMLLERMKTNPEEFVGVGKWRLLIDAHIGYLDPEDQKALKHGLNVINQQRFTEEVMEELIDPAESCIKNLGREMKKFGESPQYKQTNTPIAGVTQTSEFTVEDFKTGNWRFA